MSRSTSAACLYEMESYSSTPEEGASLALSLTESERLCIYIFYLSMVMMSKPCYFWNLNIFVYLQLMNALSSTRIRYFQNQR